MFMVLCSPIGKEGNTGFLQLYYEVFIVGPLSRTCGVGGKGTGSFIHFFVGGSCGEVICVEGDLGVVMEEIADIIVEQRGGDD